MLNFDDAGDWATNWAAFDGFVRNWLKCDFTRDPRSPWIDDLERDAGVVLPSSVREWCAFALAARGLAHFSWRDCLVVRPVPGHDAVALLIQGEADYYWAIERECLSQPDPPVVGYYLDHDAEGGTFGRAGVWAPSVTAFALDYFLSYLHSPGGGFSERLSSGHFDRDRLMADFGQPTRFGHLELLHSDGVLVVLGGLPPSWRHEVISVELQSHRPFTQFPPSIRALLPGAHITHGGLHEHR